MLDLKVFIWKFDASIDAGYTGSITLDKITTLNHEVLDYSMEFAAFVALWDSVDFELAAAKLSKVLCRFGGDVGEQLERYPSNVRGSDLDIEEANWIVWVSQFGHQLIVAQGSDLGQSLGNGHDLLLCIKLIWPGGWLELWGCFASAGQKIDCVERKSVDVS